jgi:hypothetical protein
MKRTLIFTAVFGALLLVGLAVASPFYAANRLEGAVLAGDTDTLAQFIDVDAVASDLRARMDAKILNEANGQGGLADLIAPAFVDRFVNAAASPYGMLELLKGREPGATPGYDEPKITYRWGYVSPNRFRVRTFNTITQEDGASFLMRRSGLFQWKIAKVEPPAAAR